MGSQKRNSSASSRLVVPYALVSSACEETTKLFPNFEMWFPVVKLAHMWQFDAIHKYAIKIMPYDQVSKTSSEKVGLAVHYDIQPWLLAGLNELAKRKEPLGNDDLEFLGAELALKVAAVRESWTLVHGTRAWWISHPL
ncbi:hypothetical protein OG21DRAFT_1515491 [Imleria badia]|nr:hypothetical protein OG21DRAFT_1515491 [Imleria badia]